MDCLKNALSPMTGNSPWDEVIQHNMGFIQHKTVKSQFANCLFFFEITLHNELLFSKGSARIEENNTTIIEYIDSKIAPSKQHNEQIQEIRNISLREGNISFFALKARTIFRKGKKHDYP